jgi:hypothetical protein
MSDLKATQNINFPEVRTYWIAYTNTEIFSYGYIDPDQELNSGQPYLYQTTNEDEWILELQTENALLSETNKKITKMLYASIGITVILSIVLIIQKNDFLLCLLCF